jgi:epoxyqueuosine reductase
MPDRIIEKAKSLGASLAGFAMIEELQRAPAFTFAPMMPFWNGVDSRENELALTPGEVRWPNEARSVLVIAVEHPVAKPEMDWWFGKTNPPGNRVMISIINQLCEWITNTFGIRTFHFPYAVERGGIYLKDSAVLAGLGCIGKNNMLVTAEYGPLVRLRALALDAVIPSTGPTDFDPCASCDAPCREACPQGAFNKQLYKIEDYNQKELPGRTGVYSRPGCNMQMEHDIDMAQEKEVAGFDRPVKLVKYCRRCEIACPAGRKNYIRKDGRANPTP